MRVVDKAGVSIDECVDTVLHYVRHPDFQETPASHAKLQNLRLEAHVRSALRQAPTTRTIRIAIGADQGRIKLEGVVDTAFPAMLQEARVPTSLLGRGDQQVFAACLTGGGACGTAIGGD